MENDKNKRAIVNKINAMHIIIISIVVAAFLTVNIYSCFKIYINTHVENHLKLEEIISRNNEALIEYQEPIEYGSVWKYDDFINNLIDNEKIVKKTEVILSLDGIRLMENATFNFDTLGEHELVITLNYNYQPKNEEAKEVKNDKKYTLRVLDMTPPVINGLKDKTITEGEIINLKEGITAHDNFDGEIDVTLVTELPPTQVGTYKIELIATDSSGNVGKGEYILNIIPKTITPETTTTTTTSTTTTTTKKSTTSKRTTTKEVIDTSTKSGRLYLAKQEAKRVVSMIIKPGMTDEEKAEAIYTYLHTNVASQTDQSSEAYKTNYGNEAYAALVMKIAACSGFCKAVTLLCDEAGLQSQHVNANLWIHQWNRVLINGEWIVLDAQGGIFGGTKHPLE